MCEVLTTSMRSARNVLFWWRAFLSKLQSVGDKWQQPWIVLSVSHTNCLVSIILKYLRRQHLSPLTRITSSLYLSVSASYALAMSSKGSNQIWGWQKTILVSIHDAKSFLELLDGRVGEGLEDVGFLRHLGLSVLSETKLQLLITDP